eukprot:scaffold25911_cov23-Cyclotella_meneghiniana.AAC.3
MMVACSRGESSRSLLLDRLFWIRQLQQVPTNLPAHLENLPEAYRSMAYFGSANSDKSQLAGQRTWRIFPKLILDRLFWIRQLRGVQL